MKLRLHDLVLHGGIASGSRGSSGCRCAVGVGSRCNGVGVEVLAHLSIELLDSLGLGTASASLATTTASGLGSTTSSSVDRLGGSSGCLGLVVLLLCLGCPEID